MPFAPGFRGAAAIGNDAFTKVLLHFNSSLADTNRGGSTHTWTATSAAVSGTAPKFGAGSLACTAGYVSTPDHADFAFGSSDWTVDFWINRTGLTGAMGIFGQSNTTLTASTSSMVMRFSGNALLALISDGSSLASVTGAITITDANWHHVALVRDGATIKQFVDGVLDGSAVFSGAVNNGTNNFIVGRAGDWTVVSTAFTGFIDEFRLSVGIARWTSAFTPPQRAYGPN